MHREGSMHESRPEQQIKLFGTAVVPWVGFEDLCTHLLLILLLSPFLYCCITMSWVGGSLRGFHCCTTYCGTAVVMLYCCSTAVLL